MSPQEYKNLLQKFIYGELSAKEFESAYLAGFEAESGLMDPSLYEILETVFEAVDAYWYKCEPGQETAFIISEERLLQEVKMALNKLDVYIDSTSKLGFARFESN